MNGGTEAESIAGLGRVPGLPWVAARRAVRPLRVTHALPAPVIAALEASATVADTAIPRLLVAAFADILRRYAPEDAVPLLVTRGDSRVLPLFVGVDADMTLHDAAERIRAAESDAVPRAPAADERALHLAIVRVAGRGSLALSAQGLPREVVAQLLARLVTLLAAAIRSPRVALGAIDLVTATERARLLGAWAGRRNRYPAQASLAALLRATATQRRTAVAVEDAEHRLTYAELVAQAVRLRAQLIAARVKPGARVGVLVERSAAQTVALAGVFEAGAVAVPLEATQPIARLRRMREIAGLEAIVCLANGRDQAAAIAGSGARAARLIVLAPLDTPVAGTLPALLPAARSGGARPAYVLFTSGSTGEPKGVECPHRAVVRLVVGNRLTRVRATDRVLGHTPFTFDVNLFETWGALLNGATLHQSSAALHSLAELGGLLAAHRITVSCMTPGIFREMAQTQLARFATLRLLLVAGEAMPPREAVRAARRYPRLLVVNGYGPTENNYTTEYRVRGRDAEDAPVSIGRPIDNTTVYLLDAAQRLVPPGMVGELCTGGDGLALGYVGRADLTAERFVTARFPGGRRERVYRTGDLARHRADGTLEFLGRADAQVKVRGHRVELEEVERTLVAASGVRAAAVVLVGEGAGARLRAALVLAPRAKAPAAIAAATRLTTERLPAFMVPAEFVVLEHLPLTPHEKVDRRAIASMFVAPPEAQRAAQPAAQAATPARLTALESALAGIWTELLGAPVTDRDAAFFDVGGTSLLALLLAEAIRLRLGVELPIVRVFEFPTIARLAAHLAERESGVVRSGATSTSRASSGAATHDPSHAPSRDARIAIVGMAGRFPGAASPDALWTLLREGRDGVRHFSRDGIDASIPDRLAPHYSPARGVLDGVEDFDPEFFGMNPRLAEITDPQQRLLLEAAWNAFEDAGIVPGDGERLTGVYAGVSHNAYASQNLRTHPELAEALGDAALLFQNDKDYAALHIAHRLDLRGPAMAVQTSSSTSLTAIAMAVQALRAGQCDRALAGGASVTVPVNSGHAHVEGGMFSRDGRTRTFDADASGTVFSDGVAMVLLMRLADAERDGLRILGVIHGVGVTNDGAGRASFSAPTVQGQEASVARAFADAGWRADSVSYVEAHGTGTPLGDPIEVEALTRAFARTTDRRRFCWIGSVKSNIGHCTAAAGAASVIKVLLAMRHGFIPRTLHVETPNPRIDFTDSPFLVARDGIAWETDGHPRRAGVSSFGVGGTNVHLLVEEHRGADASAASRGTSRDGTRTRRDAPSPSTARMLFLSARTPGALRARARDLAEGLRREPAPALDAVAAELRLGRRAFEHRAVVVASSREEAATALDQLAAGDDALPRTTARDAILLFPGQGAQTAGAGKTLYAADAIFRAAIDRCAKAAGRIRGKSLTHWLFADDATTAALLRETEIAQPVLYALEYALGQRLLAGGLRPAAMVGHSIGEFAAAALAEVMTPDDAMRAVVARGRLMAAMPGGAMLAVRLPAEQVRPRLGADVVVAAVNAPRLCVLAGPEAAIATLEVALTADDIGCRRLQTSHAFHSPSMDDAASRFESVMRKVTLRSPTIPFISCVSGTFITAADAIDPAYWARQLREPVRFADGLVAAAADRPVLLVEAGPRESLSALGLQNLGARAVSAALLPARDQAQEFGDFLTAVGALWRSGLDGLTWSGFDSLLTVSRAALPGYPFERRRLWVEPSRDAGVRSRQTGTARDLRGLLQDQLHLIQDQLSVLRSVTADPSAVGATE
ncbi:MAG: amino acid adenylation domain-containing protein [Gemmatimonadetes bacterium]|nr:amino acid adenylation domain-containing protein [Gemmatimonadota bacterium]